MKPSQVHKLLLNAGFSKSAAVVMTAIAGAESGFNPNAVGDVALENATWGPSIGLFQIRTLKAQTGHGGPRDIRTLKGSPQAQANAAHQIWAGSGFGAWSTYNSGAYKPFLTGAKATGGSVAGKGAQAGAAAAASAGVAQAGFWGDAGKLLNPLNWPGAIGGAAGDAAGDVAGALWSQIQPFVLTMSFAAAGLALVVIGVTVTARPAVDAASAKLDQVRSDAASAAQAAAVVA